MFLLIFARFFYVQVIWGKDLIYKATDQWNREIPIIARRGKITDTNGKILADNSLSYSVFVRSAAVVEKQKTAQILSQILSLNYEDLYKRLTSSRVSEITVARQVDKSRIELLTAQNLLGVYFAEDNSRSYAYNDILCQVLGFTSSDGSGVAGIEKYYNGILKGTDGEIDYSTDIIGAERENATVIYKPAQAGNEIRLTIDINIQLAVEDAMRSAYKSSNAKAVSCIVLNPQNFDILAMVNYPSYNLNDIPRQDTDLLNKLTRNGLVSDIYEPGSTFKIITAAANVEEYLQGNKKAFSQSYIYNGSRTRSVDSTTIKCWSTHANGKHSNQTLADALNNSCNPCFTDIALSLGNQTFYKYLSAFGFGNVTGLDFSGEAIGMLVPQTAIRDCDLARIGFGQSVAVTGIQLACASAAAVNGGNYYAPRLLKSIVSPNGKVISQNEPILKNKVISEKASKIVAEMLEGVVTEGSGKKAYIEGFRVGGKTGTAQKFENGKLAQGKYVSSFVGFFPANNPEYLALIIVDEPQGTYYGSAVAAPVAKEIFEDIIKIKNIKLNE
ncbi:MAG: hypothetical protein E7370_06025 [Clostridiales bacterium]|nr:hypothetical protein [Clostridiales bacterium]